MPPSVLWLVLAITQTPAPEAFVERRVTLDVQVDYDAPRIAGSITYELENWTDRPAATVSFILNRLMEVSGVRSAPGGPALSYTQDVRRFSDDPMRQVTQVIVQLPAPILPGARATLRLEYAGPLVGYTEVGWLYVKDHIDTAFTIIRSDALAFPVLGGMNDAANRRRPMPDFSYEAAVRVPSRYVVATGGALTRTPHDDGTVTWRYASAGESPFLNVAVAPFDTLVAEGVRIFYFPADSIGARGLLTSTQAALRTLAQWFGPRRGSASLTITEIPDGWGSQASLVGGIIQTASAFRDVAYRGELYHELSHLWNVRDTESPSPRWNEGLAMFVQHLLRERLDGWTGRAAVHQWEFGRLTGALARDTALQHVPFIDYGKRAMTNYSYAVGDLMFATLYDLLGEAQFHALLGGYYQRFTRGGSTRDFVTFVSGKAPRDLSAFFDDWMFTTRWTERLANAKSINDLASYYRPR